MGGLPLMPTAAKTKPDETEKSPEASGATPVKTDQNTPQFTPEEQRQIQVFKARDIEVRAHEQAHLSAAGGFATGGASFTFQTGPDGRRYAIGGEVQIDISSVPGDPEASLRKAETIRRAALAPASPSAQDFSVAASAASMATNARIELLKQNQQNGGSGQNTATQGTRIDIRA